MADRRRQPKKKQQMTYSWPLAGTYQALSSASVDLIWRKVVNLADVSWHPLILRTNVPYGLVPKPGFIFQAMTRWIPWPIQIFVERVSPGKLLSIRILVLPGVEERVTYRLESTVCGSQISCSVMLRGWLAPLIWSLIRDYAAVLAARLAIAAEKEPPSAKPPIDPCLDF
ncbi:hypothetical protein NK55_02495 [Thermosynechococcus sp. NK55a]|nr:MULTISPECIES: hypothetical protein [unclassified Thermosynechococcus]AHB87857.1 hypothetical protein NK55_02495 [Thermosynechococcus sp. NK55a]